MKALGTRILPLPRVPLFPFPPRYRLPLVASEGVSRILDVFPARLDGYGDAPIEKVRVYSAEGRLRVWKTGADRKVEKVLDISGFSEVEREGRHRRSPFKVLMEDGTSLTFTPDGHCGCGDPLRRLNPRNEP